MRFNFTYAQIQGKFWFGGMGAYLDYKEKEYVPVGVILEKRFLRSFKIGFDAAVVFPFNMEMTAYLSEIGGSDLDFDLGWHVGGRCELPIAWYIRPATAFYINPFYRYWNIGESNIVSGFYEPHSITHYYGVSCGVMFEF